MSDSIAVIGASTSSGSPPLEPLLRPGLTERLLVCFTMFVMLYGIPTSWFRAYKDVQSDGSDPLLVVLILVLVSIGVMRVLGSFDLMIR
ncbi:MAG: hypothetical protein R2706_07745 [Acidimicrobiales bacterium]